MKIKSIQTTLFQSPLKTPFKTALRTVSNLEDIVVIIECENGLIGYGEGSPTAVITGETLGTMKEAIEYISNFLIGLNIDANFEDIINIIHSKLLHNTTAKSALEIAIYDLISKYRDKPLFSFLGGDKIAFTTDITISLDEINKMVSDSLSAVSLGYDTLKIKLGNNAKKDIERIIEIHRALPNDTILRLDANQGWNVEQTIEIMQKVENLGIFPQLLEQPIKADDISGLKEIKGKIKTPILADESVFNLSQAKYILETKSADFLNIKLAKCGGISVALKIAKLAKEYNVKCMMGCMLEGPIGIVASLHLVSAMSDIINMVDLDAVALLANQPKNCSVIFDESHITLSKNSGLGITY
ncbi:MAG: dipeptide epimerase [Sulfurovaceae bacterium]|nr:dipeptide epimerase [Sulfurovaceae bacterium]MDD5548948.1 dipeptide epimerase [Sulfurovaceae bacterium]